jgi:hypothetical protein
MAKCETQKNDGQINKIGLLFLPFDQILFVPVCVSAPTQPVSGVKGSPADQSSAPAPRSVYPRAAAPFVGSARHSLLIRSRHLCFARSSGTAALLKMQCRGWQVKSGRMPDLAGETLTLPGTSNRIRFLVIPRYVFQNLHFTTSFT